MIKDNWGIIQCTNCDKINKVPGPGDEAEQQVQINNNKNHFDVYIPYVVSYEII
jgi:hypothetical protein